MPQSNLNEDELQEVLVDENVLIGQGDGGAHVAQLCDAIYPTYFLKRWVRERKAMSLEAAVHRLTAQPARLFGLRDRGRLALGAPADLVVFDPDAVAPGPSLKAERQSQANFDRQVQSTLLQRPSEPADIAGAVHYLLSARVVTGQMIAVDSGQHLAWRHDDLFE